MIINCDKLIPFLLLFLFTIPVAAQDGELPFKEIPPYPEKYTNYNVAARMVDGLGYRYYWVTEGLRQEDLDYRPGDDARSTAETMEHILSLSTTLLNCVKGQPNIRPEPEVTLTYEEIRIQTLENLQQASDLLKGAGKKDMKKKFRITFKRGDQSVEYPFWNMINGPIADAIYHTGQIVSFRRSSGNPVNPKVNVFHGKNRE